MSLCVFRTLVERWEPAGPAGTQTTEFVRNRKVFGDFGSWNSDRICDSRRRNKAPASWLHNVTLCFSGTCERCEPVGPAGTQTTEFVRNRKVFGDFRSWNSDRICDSRRRNQAPASRAPQCHFVFFGHLERWEPAGPAGTQTTEFVRN